MRVYDPSEYIFSLDTNYLLIINLVLDEALGAKLTLFLDSQGKQVQISYALAKETYVRLSIP